MHPASAQQRHLRPLLPTPANDAVVREAYESWRKHRDHKATARAAERLHCPRWHIKRRAKELGLTRVKEKPWSEEELELLEQEARFTPDNIAIKFKRAGFSRSPAAIHIKLTRNRLRAGVEGYSAYKLAAAFGVDGHTVTRWERWGWLKGERRGTARTPQQGGDTHYYSHEEVYNFVMHYPDAVDLWKVEKFWFLDLITKGRICR